MRPPAFHLYGLAGAHGAALRELDDCGFAAALWARRLDVWPGDGPARETIANRLGWLDAPAAFQPFVPRLAACAASAVSDGFTRIVLLGMGGSSLAPEVVRQAIGVAPGHPPFRMLDSVDPDAVRDALSEAPSTLFVVASKSGSTIEPRVLAAEAERRLRAAHGDGWERHLLAITDAGTPLHERAVADGFRDVFVNPSDIGGRYSALSFFGLVPAALMGVDLPAFLAQAAAMAATCRVTRAMANPGLALGAFMAAAARSGRDKLTLVVPPRLLSFGLWVEQLVAESTGKEGRGIVPIVGEGPNPPLGPDRAVVAVTLGSEPVDPDLLAAAAAREIPLALVQLSDVYALGAEFFRWEVATATAGLLLGVNPFDEPNVQQAKDATRALLARHRAEGRLPLPEPAGTIAGARVALSTAARARLRGDASAFLTLVEPGDYLALLAYIPPDDEAWAAACRGFRGALAAAAGCATMFGYGPRYLHSTGQLHKGGANNGLFVIVIAPPAADLPVPGEPFSFGALAQAQALGDFQSLDRAGRRALLVALPERDPAALVRVDRVLTARSVRPRP